jgi:hypothetical protein
MSKCYFFVLEKEGEGYDVKCHFQQYFSFIGGGNQRRPLTCHKEKRSYFVVLNVLNLFIV